MLKGIFTAFGTLLVVILILYLTYVCTKYLGRNMRSRGMGLAGGGRYIRVMDQMMLGQESSVALVKVSGQVLLLGVSSGKVSVLREFREEELAPLPVPEAGVMGTPDFKEILERLKDRKNKNHGEY